MKQKYDYFITTPIFYPSGKLHIGHAYTTIIADVFKRYQTQMKRSCFFLTGSDNHGEKIVKEAKKSGKDVKEFVSQNILTFIKLWKILGINYDRFIETDFKYHVNTVQNILEILKDKDLIYKGIYNTNYCIHCEEYFTNFQIKDNKCLNCRRNTKVITEDSYFLNIKKEIKCLTTNWKNNNPIIEPSSIINELSNNFINNNLQDLCISRKDFGWGIKIPFDKHYSVYVWLDAIINYLSATGYINNNFDEYEKIWKNKNCKIIHIIGKEISRFHCIYWPILLNMLNIRMPNLIIAHSWIITNEGKMSKSKGNIINPIIITKKYGIDCLRYFLMSQISYDKDYRFDIKNYEIVYNTYLANKYGNTYSRISSMYLKHYENSNYFISQKNNISETNKYIDFYNLIYDNYTKSIMFYEKLNYHKAFIYVVNISNYINKFIDENMVWNIDDEKIINDIYLVILLALKMLTFLLKPVLINKIKIIESCFQFDYNENWEQYIKLNKNIKRVKQLYPKIVFS